MIFTVQTDQNQILQDIKDLYLNGENYQVDLTYGNGSFWKHLEPPKIKADLEMKPGVSLVSDSRQLPFQTGSLRSVVFDPPFLHAANGKMGDRFGSYSTQYDLGWMYLNSMIEIDRVLIPGGVLVVKCQDCIESSKQVWNHVKFHTFAESLKLEILDLFVLARKNVMIGWNHHTQYHARKNHSYLWVFRKPVKKAKGS